MRCPCCVLPCVASAACLPRPPSDVSLYVMNLMDQRMIIFLLSLLTIVSVTYSDDSPQQHNCTELVAQGKCLSDTPFMQQHCQDDCYKWKQDIEKIRIEYIDEDEPSFFDLRAKNSTGHTINFRRFEGVITVVTVLRKVCGQKEATEAIYRSMETLHDTWPYGLEIVIFHFEHPGINYSLYDCEDFDAIYKKPRTKLHSMKVIKINGPDTHPVLKYLKNVFKMEDFDGNFAPFFLVNPDGNKVEFHRGASFDSLKDYIRRNLKREYEL